MTLTVIQLKTGTMAADKTARVVEIPDHPWMEGGNINVTVYLKDGQVQDRYTSIKGWGGPIKKHSRAMAAAAAQPFVREGKIS